MTFNQFHNALRILSSIDRDELEREGIIRHGDHNQWGEFRRNPYRWFLASPDDEAKRLWKIIENRNHA